MASSNRHHRTREEYKKQKEEEEARKAGTLPPQTDEEGRDINPHIPEYVKNAPWYLDQDQPSLRHQKSIAFDQSNKKIASMKEFVPKGFAQGPVATKYRKGACTNCGSMTHNSKNCMDRPRKTGAKYSGKDIKPDELYGELVTDYAGRHDPYANYVADSYEEVVDRFARVEKLRREARAEAEARDLLEKQQNDSKQASMVTSAEEDEFKVNAEQDNVGQFAKTDTRTPRSVRDLRIREDTAKYLVNLGPNSPFYDPKSHAMKANPRPDDDDGAGGDGGFMGDNFYKFSGETSDFYKMQRFAWETAEATQSATTTHVEASPSAAADQFKEHQAQLKAQSAAFKKQMLDTYGGAEHLQAPPPELQAASEVYREYSQDGTIANAAKALIPRSKYDEDIFPGNHKSIWGSYYHKGKWGYKCCHQMSKNAYCTGTVIDPPASSSSANPAKVLPMAPPAPVVVAGSSSKHHDSSKNGIDTISSSDSNNISSTESTRPREERAESSDGLADLDSSSSSESEDEERKSRSKKRKRESSQKHSKSKRKRKSSRNSHSGSSDSSDSSSDEDEKGGAPSRKKVLKYLEEEKKAKEFTELDDRKRRYNSNASGERDDVFPDASRMEAYMLAKDAWDDPMRKMQSSKANRDSEEEMM